MIIWKELKNPIYCCYEWDCAAGHYQDTEDNSNTTTEKEENNNGIAFVSNISMVVNKYWIVLNRGKKIIISDNNIR